jgi:hypothetical protein
MFLLAFHIVVVSLMIFVNTAIAYRMGQSKVERRMRRQLEREAEAAAQAGAGATPGR